MGPDYAFLCSSLPSTSEETVPTLPTFLLMNLLSLAGDVALQQLVHLEQAVSGELGRRRVLREEQEHRTKEPKEKVNQWLGDGLLSPSSPQACITSAWDIAS